MVFNFVSDERFRKPVTRTKLEEFGRSCAFHNSWRKARNKLVWKEPYLKEPVYNEALSSISNEDLDEVLGKFVAKLRKERQNEYPGKT